MKSYSFQLNRPYLLLFHIALKKSSNMFYIITYSYYVKLTKNYNNYNILMVHEKNS